MKPEPEDEPPQQQQLEAKPRRLYQAWKGNNIFLCGGRLIFGPDAASLLLTTFLIIAPTIIFCYQMKSKLHHSRSTGQQHMHRAALLIVIITMIMVNIHAAIKLLLQHRIGVSFRTIFVNSIFIPSNYHGFQNDIRLDISICDQPVLQD